MLPNWLKWTVLIGIVGLAVTPIVYENLRSDPPIAAPVVVVHAQEIDTLEQAEVSLVELPLLFGDDVRVDEIGKEVSGFGLRKLIVTYEEAEPDKDGYYRGKTSRHYVPVFVPAAEKFQVGDRVEGVQVSQGRPSLGVQYFFTVRKVAAH